LGKFLGQKFWDRIMIMDELGKFLGQKFWDRIRIMYDCDGLGKFFGTGNFFGWVATWRVFWDPSTQTQTDPDHKPKPETGTQTGTGNRIDFGPKPEPETGSISEPIRMTDFFPDIPFFFRRIKK
jgi:hypothetical protein